MRHAKDLMSDPSVQKKKIGDKVKRSKRNTWAEKIELDIRKLSPYPISYDVTCNQPTAFAEFTYTEFLGGMYIQCHSIDINCRIMDSASREKTDSQTSETILNNLKAMISDKYELNSNIPERFKGVNEIVFMPGQNVLDMASSDIIGRFCADNDQIMVKPHPLTNDEIIGSIARTISGYHKIVPNELSGYYFLKNSNKIYATTCSEMIAAASILEKEIINVSSYKFESTGVYYPIYRVLFNAENHTEKFVNMVNCKTSGLIFPWQDDYLERAKMFFDNALKLREIYKPLHGPINWIRQSQNFKQQKKQEQQVRPINAQPHNINQPPFPPGKR